MMLSIGLMSGTSMDGIDAALLATDGSANLLQELGDVALTYDPEFKILLKAAEYAVRQCLGNIPEAEKYYGQALSDYLAAELQIAVDDIPKQILALSQYLHGAKHASRPITLAEVIQHSTELHGLTVKKLLVKTAYQAQQIDVVGYHGQTLLHRPNQKISIIVGDGQQLANSLGITVVNDFRSRDIAAGGQGAPLAPIYHQALAVRDQKIPVAVVNCGGIANITLINNANEMDLIAYDPGPGNGLIDRLVRQRTQGREQMDANGKYGSRGKVHAEVLAALYASSIIKDNKNYFLTPPPKSLDIGDLTLIPELDSLSLADACATLEAFTADSIVNSLQLIQADCPQHWILAGGGWHNPVIRGELIQRVQQKLGAHAQVLTAERAGWNGRALEAQIFAYLAVRSLQNQFFSVPGTTGVSQPISGGKIHYL